MSFALEDKRENRYNELVRSARCGRTRQMKTRSGVQFVAFALFFLCFFFFCCFPASERLVQKSDGVTYWLEWEYLFTPCWKNLSLTREASEPIHSRLFNAPAEQQAEFPLSFLTPELFKSVFKAACDVQMYKQRVFKCIWYRRQSSARVSLVTARWGDLASTFVSN